MKRLMQPDQRSSHRAAYLRPSECLDERYVLGSRTYIKFRSCSLESPPIGKVDCEGNPLRNGRGHIIIWGWE